MPEIFQIMQEMNIDTGLQNTIDERHLTVATIQREVTCGQSTHRE